MCKDLNIYTRNELLTIFTTICLRIYIFRYLSRISTATLVTRHNWIIINVFLLSILGAHITCKVIIPKPCTFFHIFGSIRLVERKISLDEQYERLCVLLPHEAIWGIPAYLSIAILLLRILWDIQKCTENYWYSKV